MLDDDFGNFGEEEITEESTTLIVGHLVRPDFVIFESLIGEVGEVLLPKAEADGRTGAKDGVGLAFVERNGAVGEKVGVEEPQKRGNIGILAGDEFLVPSITQLGIDAFELLRRREFLVQRVADRFDHVQQGSDGGKIQFDINLPHLAQGPQ